MGSDTVQITNEEKVFILKQRIEGFKRDLKNPATFTYALYQSSTPKKDQIRAWGEALEDLHKLGVYKDEVWTISTHIRRELKDLGIPQAIDYAKRVLPFKYKDSSKIHANILLSYESEENRGYQTPDNLLSEEQIAKLNKHYITELVEDISLYEDCIEYMHHHVLVPKFKDIDEFDEWRGSAKGRRTQIREAMDGRVKVLPETFHLLMAAFEVATKSYTFAKYMEHIKVLLKLTPKQAIKLLTGRVTKVDILYEPKNRSDARFANFYGIKCGECGSWRMEIKYNPDLKEDLLYCYACKNWNQLKSERLVSKMI